MSYERLNAYHIMWLIVMFDLPVKLKKDQKAAAQFRKNLEKDGFVMHQYSVYMRYCGSLESVQVHVKRVRSFTPPQVHVTILSITDKQYSNIVNIWGEVEKKLVQLHCNWNFFSIFADEIGSSFHNYCFIYDKTDCKSVEYMSNVVV